MLPGETEVIEDVVFSPDGQSLLAVGHKRAYATEKLIIPDHGKAILWNLEDRKRLWTGDSRGWLKTAAFSRDGEQIYLGGFFTGAHVHVLDARTGAETGQFRDEALPMVEVEDLAVSPDGESVATVLVSGSVRTWSTKPGGRERGRNLDTKRLLTIAYSSDGRYLFTGGAVGKLHVLDAETLEPLLSQDHPSGSVWSVASAPDACRLLSVGGSHANADEINNNGDYAIRLWQLPESAPPKETASHNGDREIHRFEGSHFKPIKSVAVSSNGKRLLSASYDKTVRIWDVETGKELAGFWGHETALYSVAMSADGSLAASGGHDLDLGSARRKGDSQAFRARGDDPSDCHCSRWQDSGHRERAIRTGLSRG
jgi:WD40 repeat protein